MFTGIIHSVVPILSVTPLQKGVRVKIPKPSNFRAKLGDSVSLDGVCLTVMNLKQKFFEVELMPETLSKTTLRDWKKNRKINLEQSLRMGQTVDGHFVQAHVDKVEEVKSIQKSGARYELTLSLSTSLKPFVAKHGSITINGVSLTVARITSRSCTVALIPFTLKHTNLGLLKKGDEVNVEVDILARVVVGALKQYSKLFSKK